MWNNAEFIKETDLFGNPLDSNVVLLGYIAFRDNGNETEEGGPGDYSLEQPFYPHCWKSTAIHATSLRS